MSDGKSTVKPVVTHIPENLPEELLPLYDWWKANGRQSLILIALFVVVAGGGFAWRHWQTTKLTMANQELLKANSLDELESAVANHGSTKVGNAARLRLAKAYYDSAKYEEALNAYDTCIVKGTPVGFKEIAELGRAHTLEALNRLDEAMTAYQNFEKTNAEHFLQPKAIMGKARVLTLQGNRAEAQTMLENLKAEKTGDAEWEMEITTLEKIISRYEPRAARSLFDAADAAAQSLTPPPTTPPAVEATPESAPPATTPQQE